MDGHIAPLPDILALARRHGAATFVDECHATGVLGASLRGTDEHHGVRGQVDIISSTLGKALGGATGEGRGFSGVEGCRGLSLGGGGEGGRPAGPGWGRGLANDPATITIQTPIFIFIVGGYIASTAEVVTMLRQRARPYLFSNSVAPPVVAASLAAYDLLAASAPGLREALTANTTRFRSGMAQAGFALGGSPDHPIVPVMLGDARLATAFATQMLDAGIYVVGFSYPVVPKGAARIRVQLSAAHTPDQVDEAVAAFTAVGRELGVV